MAEAIDDELGVKPEMIEGSGGVFDVCVDGTRIWCKKDVGRFPEHHEVLDRIKKLMAK